MSVSIPVPPSCHSRCTIPLPSQVSSGSCVLAATPCASQRCPVIITLKTSCVLSHVIKRVLVLLMIRALSQFAASSCVVNCGRFAVFFHWLCSHSGHLIFPEGFSSHTRRSRAAFAAGVRGMSGLASACLT